jgi:SapC
LINQLLHKNPVSIDRDAHRTKKLQLPVSDWSVSASMNSTFLAATEFGDACREYPVVFVNAGKDEQGKAVVAPIAVLGVTQTENLFVHGKEWRSRYMPAVFRAYPFCTGRIDNERFAVCLDANWSGLSDTEGEALFNADGTPAPLLEQAQKQLENFENEVQRTQAFCQRLVELDVLRDMRIDATFGDGRTHSVDGFLTVDHDRLATLSDAQVVELHKNGVMGLIHAHWISLGNMRALIDAHIARHPAAVAANTAAPAAVQ